jgi:DNA-binding winged helix-turn-helix (wHTH) protein/TolB-like protein
MHRMDAGLHARRGPACRSFGPFTIDSDRAELTRHGDRIALRPKTFALLQHLADRAGVVVGKQELLDVVWPGVIVTDDSLTQAVSELRGAIGDREQTLIHTVAKRGYRLDAEVTDEPGASHPGGRASSRRTWVVAAAGVLLVATFALGFVRLGPAPAESIGAALAEGRSVVVMPFADLSEPPAPHLALGVDTDLTTDLGRLANVRVMARGSAAALGHSASVDLNGIGKTLDVRYAVTGSVKLSGEHLHITVQFAETDSGALLWTGRFDYVSAADWMLRRDISARIANLLDTRMRDAALEEARRTRPSNVAVDRWMRGSFIMANLKTRTDLMKARAQFESALAAEPDSSHALAGLASTYLADVTFRWAEDRKASLETAERNARRALSIEPLNQAGLKTLSATLMTNGQIDEAMAVTRKSLELNPYDAGANHQLAALHFFAGRWEDSLEQIKLAMRLNPLDRKNIAMGHSMIATALIPLHRYEEAIQHARLILDGPRAGGIQMIASAEAWRGNLDAARAAMAESLKRHPTTIARERGLRGSQESAYLAGMDHYYEGLRRAGCPEEE